ncbi:hypothetical protein BKA63DRAFT_572118 [Paraphoma chrysanthemicola]|nr:hypothetical protein BKA63DRAFT_572118 [Paraphoma chrysanthemicola]
MATLHQSHFRFLNLPCELRLIIYEFLPIQTKHVVADFEADPSVSSAITLLIYHIPTQLLRVCRQIRDEAKSILLLKQESIKHATPRTIVHGGAKNMLMNGNGIFTHAVAWFMAVKKNESTDFREWAASEKFGGLTGLNPTEFRLPANLP